MTILTFLRTLVASCRKDDTGFSLVEYSILTAGIVVVVVAGVAVLAGATLALFDFPTSF